MPGHCLRLLISGDVNGQFSRLFQRVSTANAKSGPFEMLFCVGNFFGSDNSEWQDCLDGKITSPVPTYVLGPNSEEHEHFFPGQQGGEMCTNITYLGKKGVFTGASGLKVVYLSGKESTDDKSTDCTFTASDLEPVTTPLLSDRHFKGIDILLTSVWSKNVTKFAFPMDVDPSKTGSLLVAKLSKAVKPRYHFCGVSGLHYERLPFRNHKVLVEPAAHPSRFIALSSVGSRGQKWMYAFTITPLVTMETVDLVRQPADTTESPYQFPNESSPSETDTDRVQYFFDTKKGEDNLQAVRKRRSQENLEPLNAKRAVTERTLSPCWFCLGSPKAEKHLVVSIGEEVYLSLAKGGLVQDHILISTIGHYQSTVELQQHIIDEIEKFKNALIKFYATRQKVVVFFERNYRTQHLQVQAVPLPHVLSFKIKNTFLQLAQDQNILLDELPPRTDLLQVASPGVPYFYVELPTGEKLLTKSCKSFPLQFGREALAHARLLNLPNKIEWRGCVNSVAEETDMARGFKASFTPFDFTL